MSGLPTWLSVDPTALDQVKAACRAVLEARTGPELLKAMGELETVVIAQRVPAPLFEVVHR